MDLLYFQFVLQLLMRGLVNASPIILEFASGEVNELMPRSEASPLEFFQGSSLPINQEKPLNGEHFLKSLNFHLPLCQRIFSCPFQGFPALREQ